MSPRISCGENLWKTLLHSVLSRAKNASWVQGSFDLRRGAGIRVLPGLSYIQHYCTQVPPALTGAEHATLNKASLPTPVPSSPGWRRPGSSPTQSCSGVLLCRSKLSLNCRKRSRRQEVNSYPSRLETRLNRTRQWLRRVAL